MRVPLPFREDDDGLTAAEGDGDGPQPVLAVAAVDRDTAVVPKHAADEPFPEHVVPGEERQRPRARHVQRDRIE